MTTQNRLIPTLLATVAILALAPTMATASMFKKPAPAAEAPAPAPAEPPKAAEQPKPDTPAPAVAVEAPPAPAVAAPSAEVQAQPVQQAEPEAKPKAAAKPATKAPAPAKKAVAAPQPRSWSGYAIAPDTASVQFADGVRLQLAGIAGSGDATAVQAMTAYVFQRGGLICREVKAQTSTVTCRTINGGHNLAAAAVHNGVATTLDAKYLR